MEDYNCPFCELSKDEIILENDQCFVRLDSYPVNQGHLLIIPFRHFSNYFDSTPDEIQSILDLINKAKVYLDQKYKPDGYNIGINVNQCAGQTVMHLHVHIIPRYEGDMENPQGGVRGVIPEKRVYRK
jgi:diadenosine tetraphosphate (Ap4A) HIT family hydrolase